MTLYRVEGDTKSICAVLRSHDKTAKIPPVLVNGTEHFIDF